MLPEKKRCGACNEQKKLDQFNICNKNKLNGRQSMCKPCKKQRHKERAHIQRGAELQRAYGLSLEQYQDLLTYQEGRCALCLSPEEKTYKNGAVYALAVDHCHKIGKVRSLLCSRCNTGIGRLRESKQILHSLIEYLSRPKALGL